MSITRWSIVIRLGITNTRISKQSNLACSMPKTFEMILVFPYGFQLMTTTINRSRLFIWCISGRSIHPFLSFWVQDKLMCLLYTDIQAAVKASADYFGLDKKSFKTQSIRMSAPTIARTAKLSVPNIMKMGRWKSLPAPLLYQEKSTALNDHILAVVNNPTLFTVEDVQLSRVLASRNASSSQSTV